MGCWHAPSTTKDAEAIRKLMMMPLMKGDAEDALYNLIGDDELADNIYDVESGSDVRPIVLNFLQTWFGENGDDEELRESWGWRDPFQTEALRIYKEMLTDWNESSRFPKDMASNGDTIMTPRLLADYVHGFVADLAKDSPREAAKIFRKIFPDISITAKRDGSFHVAL